MTLTSRFIIASSLSVASMTAAGQQPSPAEALFQKGLLLERAEGNLTQAVVLYERVVAEHPTDRVVLPQALFHLARVYGRTDTQRATRMWSRIATEFGTTQYADEARRILSNQQAQAAGSFRMRSLDPVVGDVPQNELYFSPDGRTASYVKSSQLFFRDLSSGKDRRMVDAPGHQLTDTWWSPDGLRMVFLIRDLRSGTGFHDRSHELRALTVATGQVRTLARAPLGLSFYSWSPDSQRVAIVLGWCCRESRPTEMTGGTVQIVNVISGDSREVAGPAREVDYDQLAWSPNSRELAFRTGNPGQADAFRIVSVDTGQIRELPIQLPVSGPNNRVNLVENWRTSGWKTTAQIHARQGGPGGQSFYLVPIAGGAPKPTCANVSRERWCGSLTPDGATQIIENLETRRLSVLDVGSGRERRVSGGFGEEHTPMLSPDGKLLAFLGNPDGRWALYVVPVDATPVATPLRVTVLDDYPGNAHWATWSRDGRLIVGFRYDTNNVYRINMDRSGRASGPAGRLTQDTHNNFTASVSPDGSRIAYWYINGAKRGIALMMADGSGEHPIAEGTPGPWRWASADEALVWRRVSSGKPGALTALNVKTGAVRTLFEFKPEDDGHQYLPSRNEVVYSQKGATASERAIRARSLTDGSDRVLTTLEAFFGLVVSPDGQQIAYGKWVGAGSARTSELRVVNSDGTGDRALAASLQRAGTWNPGGHPADWSPDGKFLLYDEFPGSNSGSLRVVDVRSGQSWAIAEATNDETQRWYDAQWAPDGSFIVVSRNFARTEYRSFEGVTYDAVVKLMSAGKK